MRAETCISHLWAQRTQQEREGTCFENFSYSDNMKDAQESCRRKEATPLHLSALAGGRGVEGHRETAGGYVRVVLDPPGGR